MPHSPHDNDDDGRQCNFSFSAFPVPQHRRLHCTVSLFGLKWPSPRKWNCPHIIPCPCTGHYTVSWVKRRLSQDAKKCRLCEKSKSTISDLKHDLDKDGQVCNFVMLFCLLAPPWNMYCVSKYLRAIMNPTPPRWALPPPPPKARNTRWIFHVHDWATT